MKFTKARSAQLLKSIRSFSTSTEHQKAAPAKHDENHKEDHHDSHETIQPYSGKIVQSRFSNIFHNEENVHVSRSFYNVLGNL